jgi:hypothetical protein
MSNGFFFAGVGDNKKRYRNFFSRVCNVGLGMFVQGPAINNDSGSAVRGYFTSVGYTEYCLSLYSTLANSFAMASRFFPSRRTGIALVAGCLLFSAFAAANVGPGELSVGQIEEQLQVCCTTYSVPYV